MSTTPTCLPAGDPTSLLSSSLPELAFSPFLSAERFSLLPTPESPIPTMDSPATSRHRYTPSTVSAPPTVQGQEGKSDASDLTRRRHSSRLSP